VKVNVGVLDESTGVELQTFRPETRSLFSSRTRRHVWADSTFRSNHAMPRQHGGFFVREAAEDKCDVTGRDIHVNGNASIGRELSRWNESDQTKDLFTDPSEGDGFRLGHTQNNCG
jgi:hypothetical protein